MTTFVDQTKDNILRVQTEIRNLSATVDTLATEMKEDREAQKKAAAGGGRMLNKTVDGIGEKVASALAMIKPILGLSFLMGPGIIICHHAAYRSSLCPVTAHRSTVPQDQYKQSLPESSAK